MWRVGEGAENYSVVSYANTTPVQRWHGAVTLDRAAANSAWPGRVRRTGGRYQAGRSHGLGGAARMGLAADSGARPGYGLDSGGALWWRSGWAAGWDWGTRRGVSLVGLRVCFRVFSGGRAGLGGVVDGWALGIHSSITISNRNYFLRFRFRYMAGICAGGSRWAVLSWSGVDRWRVWIDGSVNLLMRSLLN